MSRNGTPHSNEIKIYKKKEREDHPFWQPTKVEAKSKIDTGIYRDEKGKVRL